MCAYVETVQETYGKQVYWMTFLWQLLGWIVHSSLEHCVHTAPMSVTTGQLCRQAMLLLVYSHVTITLQCCRKVLPLSTAMCSTLRVDNINVFLSVINEVVTRQPTGINLFLSVVTYYGRPLSVSGRPCYILPMFFYLFIYLFIYFYGRLILRGGPWVSLEKLLLGFFPGHP